jgi:hypothetical protein
MPSKSLPAASLRTTDRLPAARTRFMGSKYLIYMELWPIRRPLFGVESCFLPALRGARPITSVMPTRPSACASVMEPPAALRLAPLRRPFFQRIGLPLQFLRCPQSRLPDDRLPALSANSRYQWASSRNLRRFSCRSCARGWSMASVVAIGAIISSPRQPIYPAWLEERARDRRG